MEERREVFRLEMAVRWGDMDAMGHVNNTVYFRYMEQTRISWFEAMGFPPNPLGEGPLIINAHCTFLRQIAYPGTVLCRHHVGRIGSSSVETWVTMARTDAPDTICAEGGAKIVWVDFPKQKSRPIPDWARAAITTPR